MIKFIRAENKVVITIEHGISCGDNGEFEMTIQQSYNYQARLLRDALDKHLHRQLAKIQDKYYREGWKAAKAKTRKRTEFYGGWE